MAGSVTHAFHTGDRQKHCARSHSKHSISPYCFRAVFFPLCFLELLPEDTTLSKQLLQFRQQAANIVCPPTPSNPSHNHHQRLPLGLTLVTPPLEKSTKRPLCESTETWVMLLYIIVFSHCHTTTVHSGTVSSSGGASLSPLTFSQPLSPWHDAQTTHCPARPATPSKWMWICWYGLLKKTKKKQNRGQLNVAL